MSPKFTESPLQMAQVLLILVFMDAIPRQDTGRRRLIAALWQPIIAFAALSIVVATAHAQAIFTPIASFADTNSTASYGVLVQAADGSFYGTTMYGGENTPNDSPPYGTGYGTVFKVTPNGTFTTVASFNGTNGSSPKGGLVDGGNGTFYGTTWFGGTSNLGTIFRVTTNGELTALVSFVGTNGSWPQCALVKGSDGNFYGTTRQGGVDFDNPPGSGNPGEGTIFKVTPDGTLATLYSFTSTTDGSNPFAPLLLATDGIFYGTAKGGTYGWGIIFRMTPDGTVTTLASLSADNGIAPYGGLIQGSDGNFYALSTSGPTTTSQLIKIYTNGLVTNLATVSLDANNRAIFDAPIEGTDGNFYGTLPGNLPGGNGTVFQVRPDGSFTNIVNFNGTNGIGLGPGLLQAMDGSFYGTGGSVYTPEFVFRLTVPSATSPLIRSLNKSETNVSFTWGTLVGRNYQVQSTINLDSTNWVNFGPSFTATNQTVSATDSITSAPQRFYRIVLLP